MKKCAKFILSAGLALAISLPVTAFASETTITIFHTNDIHGRFAPSATGIGIDTVAAIHAGTENSILVDVGDTLHGTPFAGLRDGADAVELMNAAGFDLFTPGNHDLTYGPSRLLELRDMADFEFVSSNMFDSEGNLLFSSTAIVEVDGIRVGFFGLLTPDTAYTRNQDHVEGVSFGQVFETATLAVEELREAEADIVVALVHLGSGFGPNASGTLAQTVPGIDLIIDGHSHTTYPNGSLVNDVLIASSGNHLRFLGRVDIAMEDGAVASMAASLISAEQTADVTPMGSVTTMIDEVNAILEEQGDDGASFVVGYLGFDLYHDDIRSEEMPLGNLIADALRVGTGADFAAANGGGIRDDLFAGDVTIGQIIAVMPFGNLSITHEITPAGLREVLENAVFDAPSASSRFLQISGFSFTYDPAAEMGFRVLSIEVDGEELDLEDDATTFVIAINDFMSEGGNDYTMFADMPLLGNYGYLHDLVVGFIQYSYEDISPDVQGRIVASAGELPEEVADEADETEEVTEVEEAVEVEEIEGIEEVEVVVEVTEAEETVEVTEIEEVEVVAVVAIVTVVETESVVVLAHPNNPEVSLTINLLRRQVTSA